MLWLMWERPARLRMANRKGTGMVDACGIGLCEFYSNGGQALGLIVGGTVGAILIALMLRRRRQRRGRKD